MEINEEGCHGNTFMPLNVPGQRVSIGFRGAVVLKLSFGGWGKAFWRQEQPKRRCRGVEYLANWVWTTACYIVWHSRGSQASTLELDLTGQFWTQGWSHLLLHCVCLDPSL